MSLLGKISLLLTLSTGISAWDTIYRQPVKYDVCKCPCDLYTEPVVWQTSKVTVSCASIRTLFTKQKLFTSDRKRHGVRFVYHDTSTVKRWPHTAFWKLYYPWNNISVADENVPLLFQNILYQDYMCSTEALERSNERLVVMSDKIFAACLWYVDWDHGTWKIRNMINQELLYYDMRANHDTGQGRVFTDTKNGLNHPDLDVKPSYSFNWRIDHCGVE